MLLVLQHEAVLQSEQFEFPYGAESVRTSMTAVWICYVADVEMNKFEEEITAV
jgi:hypothetical protein